MIVVFWRQALFNSSGLPTSSTAQSVEFESNELVAALGYCEALRKQRREGAFISHVCIQSELSESVGQAGVDDIDLATYSWFKRRINPAITLGRPKDLKCLDSK